MPDARMQRFSLSNCSKTVGFEINFGILIPRSGYFGTILCIGDDLLGEKIVQMFKH